MMGKNLGEIPDDLPVPLDDGACDHLAGFKFIYSPTLNR